MLIEVDRFLDRLFFGRHQFCGTVDFDSLDSTINTEDSVIISEPFTEEDTSLSPDLILPITFRLQVYPNGFDQDRQEFLSVILTSQIEDESLRPYRLISQITAIMWIESISAAAEVPNKEDAIVLVPRKSITLPIEQFCEVERIRETFSRLVQRGELREKCNNAEENSFRIYCKITIEPNFGNVILPSVEERTALWVSRHHTHDLLLNFSPSRFDWKQNTSIQAHQWMLMRTPGWRRYLFAYQGHNKEINNRPSNLPSKVLIIPAPNGLQRWAILEQLRFYYGQKLISSNNNVKTRITNFRHFQALVDVALFAEDRDFMAKIFGELLVSCDDSKEDLLCLDLPTALAFRRLAKRHNVLPVVEKYDSLIEQIVERMRRQIVEASDLIPLEAIILVQPQQPQHQLNYYRQPMADPLLNHLMYTMFDRTAVECFLSNRGGVKEEVDNMTDVDSLNSTTETETISVD